jgi:hypothetical protein
MTKQLRAHKTPRPAATSSTPNDKLFALHPTTLNVLLAFCRPLDRRSPSTTAQTEIEKTPPPPPPPTQIH